MGDSRGRGGFVFELQRGILTRGRLTQSHRDGWTRAGALRRRQLMLGSAASRNDKPLSRSSPTWRPGSERMPHGSPREGDHSTD
ncbi:hypothetical protein D187_008681 [Cystobacter fuscus DSM 2262]|uniref:Uncharacterized protein n=1 Tax=Cystobacter fuscus (strain ATCC 25194 / DSM 2262 / NBRC 100088 / M29) TaxID=1242864 RepID=S9R0Q3_CYSF2|nr:hypothetical protein D187_008681 [Cystobacter fuscus DSM 2262]